MVKENYYLARALRSIVLLPASSESVGDSQDQSEPVLACIGEVRSHQIQVTANGPMGRDQVFGAAAGKPGEVGFRSRNAGYAHLLNTLVKM